MESLAKRFYNQARQHKIICSYLFFGAMMMMAVIAVHFFSKWVDKEILVEGAFYLCFVVTIGFTLIFYLYSKKQKHHS